MTHKVLIIEDDVEDQLLFIETIHKIDPFYSCICVGNGSEAMNFLKNTTTLPSIILLDLNMPLMDGYEFLGKVKLFDEFKDIPIFVFSTSNAAKDEQRTRKLGAKRFFTKPNNIAELTLNLRSVFFE